jgi:oligopeptide transport system substrate-binding protein
VSALAANAGGGRWDEGLTAELYRETEGNPLFVVETLRAGLPGPDTATTPRLRLPPTVQEVIAGRLAQLSPPARELVGIAATIGREFTPDTLAQVSRVDEDTIVQGLDELWQRRIIREQSNAYTFSHDKIREFAYLAQSTARRRHLHRRIAQTIETHSPTKDRDRLASLAFHYSRTDASAKALQYLSLAGDSARDLQAFDTAINFYQRALAIQEQSQDYTAAARTSMKIGLIHQAKFEFPEAQSAYEAGFACIQKATTVRENKTQDLAPQTLCVVGRAPLTLDPTRAHDFGSTRIIDQLFRGLVELGPDQTIMPAMAQRWELLDGGCEYVFYLRQDALWSDGVAVTASDFLCAWGRILGPEFQSPIADVLGDIKGAKALRSAPHSDAHPLGIQAPTAHTLVIELEQPNSYFLFLLAKTFAFPIPRHLVELHGDRWAEPDKLVTNGPFQLESTVDGKSLTIVRSRTYHGEMTGNVERVECLWIDDWQKRLELYEEDKIDVLSLWNLPPAEMNRVRQRKADDYLTGPWFQNTFIGLNTKRAPFDDVNVRRAFAHALDRSYLSHYVKHGYDAPATGGFVPPGMFGHSPEIGLPHDPEKARGLLSEAGYPDGHGFPAVRGIMYEAYEPLNSYIEDQWRTTLGVDVQWESLSWREFQNKSRHDTPDLIFSGWVADYPDPDNILRIATHTTRSGWQDERFAELVDQARSLRDPSARRRDYQEADRILIDQVGLIPISYGRWHLLVKPRIKRFPASPLKYTFWKDIILEPSAP